MRLSGEGQPGDPLTVLLYGDFSWDHLGTSYRRAFEQLEHEVVCIDVRDARRQLTPWMRNRIGHRLTLRSARWRRVGSTNWNQHIVETGRRARPDLALLLNGEFVMPETVRGLRALGTRVFIFHADNPFPAHSSSRPENLACAAASDCYFIWSRQLCEQLLRVGVRPVEYLPFAWDPEVFPHLEPSAAPEHDVVFIGGWDEEREQALEPLARRFDLKIFGPAYWGSRTRRKSAARHSWQGCAPRGADAAEIIAQSRIVLNVLRRQNLPDGTVMRTFEVPGCGGVSISTRTAGALAIFPESVAGAYFASPEECADQIACLLAQPERRRDMALAAHRIVSANHRYVDRARQILDVYRELP